MGHGLGGNDDGQETMDNGRRDYMFKNKYRIESIRLKGWNYSNNGMYSVTICTKEREISFGNIINRKMKLSRIGQITQQYWNEIPKHYPNVGLDEFVAMPNHIHGIIVIDHNGNRVGGDGRNVDIGCRDEALPRLYHRNYIGEFPQMSKISPKPNSLSSIIGSYKSICTKQIHKLYNPNFQWQSRFYDHIVRNEKSLNHIREYIRNNPLKWECDRNNPHYNYDGNKGRDVL